MPFASRPLWEETLLLITYDEHGGFYDHVPPPQRGVPSPDGICTKEGFNYQRLGVRIPTVAVSPWIQRNTLVHEAPDAQKPQDTSQYELSSIPATLRKLFPQLGGPLTQRDAWAAGGGGGRCLSQRLVAAPHGAELARTANQSTSPCPGSQAAFPAPDLPSLDVFVRATPSVQATFEHLWAERTTPRDDCPARLPDVPPPPEGEMERTLGIEIDEHAVGLMSTLCQMVQQQQQQQQQEEEEEEGESSSHGEGACSDEERAKVKTYHEFAPWVTRVWGALGPWGVGVEGVAPAVPPPPLA